LLNEEELLIVKRRSSLFNMILVAGLCIYHLMFYTFNEDVAKINIYFFLSLTLLFMLEFMLGKYDFFKSDFLYIIIKMVELTMTMIIVFNARNFIINSIIYVILYCLIALQLFVTYDVTEIYSKIEAIFLSSLPMLGVTLFEIIFNGINNFYVFVFIAFIIIIEFCEYVSLDIYAEVLDKLYVKINSLNGIASVNREENNSMKVTQAKLLQTNEQLSIQRFKLQEANEQITRNSEETQLQNYIMKNFTSSLDIDKMLEITIDAIMDGLKCDLVSIGIISNEPNEDVNFIKHSEYTKESGINEELIKGIESRRFIKECHNHNIVIEIANYANVKYEYISGSTIKSLIVIPATINENAYCVYTFGSCKKDFFEKNKDFIQNLSNQITLAISNSLLYMKMRTMAIKDPLTGIYNRRHFNVMSDTFKKNYIDKNRNISVVLFDIDKFKNINDTYGHVFGDEVISFCGKIANKYAKIYDGFPVRYGGEEFVIVYTDKDSDKVREICEEMHNEIKTKRFEYGNKEIFINISVGIATYPTYCSEFEELVNAADSAMYSSKKNGRGRITVYADM